MSLNEKETYDGERKQTNRIINRLHRPVIQNVFCVQQKQTRQFLAVSQHQR
jgi:hypothetical protein